MNFLGRGINPCLLATTSREETNYRGFRFGTKVRLDSGEVITLGDDPTSILYLSQKGQFTVIYAPEAGPGAAI